jgi:hypothetical protein
MPAHQTSHGRLAIVGLAAEHEILQLTARTTVSRETAGRRLELLSSRADWTILLGLLREARLLPTLGPRILEAAGEHVTEEFKASLEEALVEGRHQDALLQLISARITNALAAAGVRSTVLKGPQLGEVLYGEPGRRRSSDIDLLVGQEHLGAAVDVARELGYARPRDHVEASGLPLLHFTLIHERGEFPPLELHWRIHWYESRFARDRLLAPRPDPSGRWQPAPADQLAALLLYYARDGFTGLRQATDLGAWWDRFGDELPEGGLASIISAYPRLRRAVAAAVSVAVARLGLPPSPYPRSGAELGTRGRIAVSLATRERSFPSRQQLFAEIGLIDGLLTPPRGLGAFLGRQVAPPFEVIQGQAEKGGSVPVGSRAGYALRMLVRYAMALGGRLRRHKSRPHRSV